MGFGLGPFSGAAFEPLRAYATDAIGATGAGAFWRDMDADHDGAISTPELRAVFDTLTSVDLDLGQPTEADAVSYTHIRAHETALAIVCPILLENKKTA